MTLWPPSSNSTLTSQPMSPCSGARAALCAGWDLKAVSDLDQSNPVGNIDFPKDGGKAPVDRSVLRVWNFQNP